MSIKELKAEQVRTMSLREKDAWWLANVYQGDLPQLNLRSGLAGVFLGGVLSLTNLYVGIRTGWTLGVGVTSVILSYAMFKALSRLSLGREMTILENNAMQSIATSAGYMTAPLIASVPAYMMVTNQVVPMWHVTLWSIAVAILGVLFAFPLKKRFINDEQLRFPEGRASGIVLDNLHADGDGREGMFKAKLLLAGGGLSALIEVMRSHAAMSLARLSAFELPEFWDDLIYKFATPTLFGIPMKDLTIHLDTSIVMAGTGGLMSMRSAASLMVGAFLNYFLLVPMMLDRGVIPKATYADITMWSLWGGVAMMTTSALYGFFAKPQIFVEAFRGLAVRRKKEKDPLAHIELPMIVSVIGIPIVGGILVYFGHAFFGVDWWLGALAIPLVFVFTLISVTSTGLTGITPGSSLGKLTQLTYSGLAPGNVSTNLMTAGITSEVSLSASNLLSDIKPGYMLGAKPRQQAIGHVLGIFAGAFVAVPVFYKIFHGDISLFTSPSLPMPSAVVWRAVAQVLTGGLENLHPTARAAAVIGAVLGIVLEFLEKRTRGRWPISGVGMGLAFVLPFTDSLSMGLGAFFFWVCRRRYRDPKSFGHRAFVANQETFSAGVVAGGALVGIILILIANVS